MQTPSPISEHVVYALSLWTIGLGVLIALCLVAFGVILFGLRRWWRREDELIHLLLQEFHSAVTNASSSSTKALTTVGAVYAEYLARRNDFWRTYGQISVAVLLLVVITVLLLTKTISPDAGLPILSAIAGFAIAKGGDATRGIPRGTEGEG